MNALAPRRRSCRRTALLALAACLVAIPLLALAGPADADLSFCPPGSGAGQCSNPQGVATDFETGHVYVADLGNNRVNVFESDGDFLFSFAGSGSGAGQLNSPRWIAVDNVVGSPTRHHVYVVDNNSRVNHFEANGTFVNAFGWGVDTGAAELQTCTTASTCQAGTPDTGIPAPAECRPGGAHQPISVGPGGNVFVVANPGSEPNFTAKVMKFSPAGTCLGETVLIKGNFRLKTLAVDAAEDAYVSVERAGGETRKYDLAAAETQLCSPDPGINTNALGLDDAGHLFAYQIEPPLNSGSFQVITEYDGACNKVRRFGYGKIQSGVGGLAPLHTAQGDVFATQSTGDGVRYLASGSPGPIVVPASLEADPVRSVWAAIEAEVNPEGKATSYRVDYLSQADYEAQGNSFVGPATRSSPVTPLSIPAGQEFRVQAAEAIAGCKPFTEEAFNEGKCLEPETAYRYRIVATNADNPPGAGDGTVEGTLTTKPPIEVGDVYATDVGTDAATLNADVNPFGIPAGGFFEYVEEETFQESGFANAIRIPDTEAGAEPIDFGAAEASTRRSASPFPLPPGTTYRYRLIATNPYLEAPIVTAAKSFTTFRPQTPEPGTCPANEAFRAGAAALLPDCRAYELVSPLDKANGDIVVLPQVLTSLPAVLSQSATSGSKLAYGSARSFGDAPSAPYTSQYIAERGAGGWASHGISPPNGPQVSGIAEFDFEVKALSPDLCRAWVVPLGEVTLAEGEVPGTKNIYRHDDPLCGEERYEAITTANPASLTKGQIVELQGHSGDGEIAAFVGNDTLEGSGAPAQPVGCVDADVGPCQMRLYVKGPGGGPRYACVLPGGAPHSGSCSAGTAAGSGFGKGRSANLANALSADGKRLFWTDSTSEGKIYLRENPLAEGAECTGEGSPCTIPVSEAGEEESGTSASRFWAAAKDGSTAIFSTGPSPTDTDLYEYDVAGEATNLIAGGTSGVVGTSEDATHVYFASTEVLTGEEVNSEGDKAVAGEPNLYLYDAVGGGTYRFVATLAGADVIPAPPQGQSSATGFEPLAHSPRVSPDGLSAAFMSEASLTGYDNTDAASGKADTEVFLYDAEANGGVGEIVCASCNPSGGRPAGDDFGSDEEHPFWVAARLPVWTTSLYPGRLLSDDGSRLYFESQDSLAARDTNGRIDVYQWEEEGAGSCDADDVTFVPDSGGCVDLVSSGKGLTDSAFVDGSPSGNDVFFTTLASLVPQDYGLTDIYDARAGGGFPAPPAPPAPCQGDACQSPAPPPNDPTPASASFRGVGDPRPASDKPRKARCPKGKRRVRRAGKTRCAKRSRAKASPRPRGRTAR